MFLLNEESVFLACWSRCSCDQKRNQYVPLKMTYKIELTLILLKIISLRHLQIAQHTAATPTQMKFLIFLDWLDSQELNIWLIDLGGVKPVA